MRFRLGEKIGGGAYGNVYLALNEASGSLMAAKVIHATKTCDADALRNEIDLLRTLEHRHIVKYLGTSEWQGSLVIFTEWVSGGSLKAILKRFKRLGESLVRTYAYQMVQGLAHLHRCNVAHRDIKPGNILVDNEGVVKLADFGASTRISTASEGTGATDAAQGQAKGMIAGTPYYMSPELIRGSSSDYKSHDVWSLGCTLLELVSGQPPWKSLGMRKVEQLLVHIASARQPPQLPADLSPAFRALLLRCFDRDVATRPTAEQLLADPWFAQGDLAEGGTVAAATKVDAARGTEPTAAARAGAVRAGAGTGAVAGAGAGAATGARASAAAADDMVTATRSGGRRAVLRKYNTLAVPPRRDGAHDGEEDDGDVGEWSDEEEEEEEEDDENLMYGLPDPQASAPSGGGGEGSASPADAHAVSLSAESFEVGRLTDGSIAPLRRFDNLTEVTRFVRRHNMRTMKSLPV